MYDAIRALSSAYARRRARRAMRDGAIYRHPMDTPAGKIRTWATVSVEGSTVTLNDVSIYPEKPGAPALALGLRELVRLRDEVAANAALAGYETLRITAVRTDRHPGCRPTSLGRRQRRPDAVPEKVRTYGPVTLPGEPGLIGFGCRLFGGAPDVTGESRVIGPRSSPAGFAAVATLT